MEEQDPRQGEETAPLRVIGREQVEIRNPICLAFKVRYPEDGWLSGKLPTKTSWNSPLIHIKGEQRKGLGFGWPSALLDYVEVFTIGVAGEGRYASRKAILERGCIS